MIEDIEAKEDRMDAEETSAFLPADKEASTSHDFRGESMLGHHRSRRPELPWMISTCVLAILLPAALLFRLPSWSASRPVQEIASTELPALQKAIAYEYQQYTGMITFNESSRRMIRLQDGDIEFFGRPTDELDAVWEEFLHDEFPVLKDDELPYVISDQNRMPDGHFHFEPDFFHNLHCVNEIRKQISKVLYPELPLSSKQQEAWDQTMRDLGPEWNVIHIEHCMDRLRQALMCAADLTPSIMHRWDNYFLSVGQTGPRKCRKWGPIRQWMDERNAAFKGEPRT